MVGYCNFYQQMSNSFFKKMIEVIFVSKDQQKTPIQTWREMEGLTLQQVEDAIGIERSKFSKIERGKLRPGIHDARKIKSLFPALELGEIHDPFYEFEKANYPHVQITQ